MRNVKIIRHSKVKVPYLSLQLPPSVAKEEVGEVVVVVGDVPCTVQHHQPTDIGEHLTKDNSIIHITTYDNDRNQHLIR